MKRRENKDNFSRNKVNKDKNKGKENGINFSRHKQILKIQNNQNQHQHQHQKRNKSLVGKIVLIILLNKTIFLLSKEPVQRKIRLFHKIMKKYVERCKESNVCSDKNKKLIKIFVHL